jgi:hypothetical protein
MASTNISKVITSAREGAVEALRGTREDFAAFGTELKNEFVPTTTISFEETAQKAKKAMGGWLHVPYFPAFHRYDPYFK